MSETGMVKFDFEGHNSRVITDEQGELWFVAKDILETLGYNTKSKASRIFAHVPDQWKGVKPIHTLGGEQEMLCISEQGLYFFLGRSDKPKALPYQMKVAGEVMPKLRKTGGFALPGSQMDMAALKSQNEVFAAEILKAGMRINHLENKCANYQSIIKRIGFDPDDYEKTNQRGDKRIRIVRARLRGGKNCQITYKGDLMTIALMMQPNLPFIETVEAMPERLPFTKSQVALIKEAKSSAIQRREAAQ